MRAFPVRLPSGVRYWTVLDGELAVVTVADEFLRHLRFGRDGAESTTKAYAIGIALFLRWCARSGRSWQAGAGPGDGPLVIDIDSFVGEVHGYQKQGAGYGYTHKRGYHPIVARRRA